MYESFYGLRKLPFSLSPDTQLFVNLSDHKQCFSLILYAIKSGEGFLKVIGEVGTGKTILCRKLLGYLDKNKKNSLHTIYIPNPMLSPIGLYRAVGHEMGLDVIKEADNDALLIKINERILELAELDQSVVLIVDEAQSLPEKTLEALRLITNLETESKKLVQIVLFGQPELDQLLNLERFRQLKQRITFAHTLQALSFSETQQFITHRLSQCGYNGPALFSKSALSRVYKSSRGVPRMINVIAHKSLLSAFSERSLRVNDQHVCQAIEDSQSSVKHRRFNISIPFQPVLFASSMALILILVVTWRLL